MKRTIKPRHIRWKILYNDADGFKFEALNQYTYYSSRYNRSITVPLGFKSDGASGAWDILSDAWGVHDVICERGTWDDGAKLSNWDASTVLRDILYRDGYWFRAWYWWIATFLFGGGEARKNGMRRVKNGND